MMKDIHLFEPGPASWGIGCIICKLPENDTIHRVNALLQRFEVMNILKQSLIDMRLLKFTDKEILELVEFNLKGK